MCICWVIGRGIGALAQRTVDQQIKQYKEQFPIPDTDAQIDDQDDQVDESDVEVVGQSAAPPGSTQEVTPVSPGT